MIPYQWLEKILGYWHLTLFKLVMFQCPVNPVISLLGLVWGRIWEDMVTIFKTVQSSCIEQGRKLFTRTTTGGKRNGIRSQQGRFRSGSSNTSGKGVGVLRNRWDKVVLRNCSLQSVQSHLLQAFYGWKMLYRQSAVRKAVWGEVHHCCTGPVFHISVFWGGALSS